MRLRIPTSNRAAVGGFAFAGLFLLAFAAWVVVEPSGAQDFADELSAVSANVRETGRPVQIRILEWSSEEDRDRLITALEPPPPEPVLDVGEDVDAGRGGRGAQAGRGGARGRGGPGGRGSRGGRGGEPVNPVLAALDEAPTVGYIWTDQVAGYAIRYASRASLPDGGERIVLVTNRRLGVYTTDWDPVDTDYDFTVVEIRLDADGEGEGKASLTTGVVVDAQAGIPVLEDYEGTTTVLENVRR